MTGSAHSLAHIYTHTHYTLAHTKQCHDLQRVGGGIERIACALQSAPLTGSAHGGSTSSVGTHDALDQTALVAATGETGERLLQHYVEVSESVRVCVCMSE